MAKKSKHFKTIFVCLLVMVSMVISGCNNGVVPASSTVSTDSTASIFSTGSKGTSSQTTQTNPTTSTGGTADSNNTTATHTTTSTTVPTGTTSTTGKEPYDYDRPVASSDWNKRFNISTGFAMGGGGNRSMYDKIVSQTKAANFTTIEITAINVADPDPDGPGKAGVRNVIRTALDACRQYNIGAYVADPYLGGWGNEGRVIEERHIVEALEAYKDYEDIIQAYFLWDEPFKEQFPEVKKRYDWIRKYNKNVRLFTNLFPSYGVYGWGNTEWGKESYTGYVDGFVETVKPDMLSVDYYAFGVDGANQPDVLSSTQMLWRDMGYFRKKALENNIPFEFYLQCAGNMFDTFDRTGNMTIEKISFQMWNALAYGAKRISYWTSYGVLLDGNGDKMALYEPIKALNKEALAVGEFLYNKTPDKIYHSGVGNLARVREGYYIDDIAQSPLISEIPTESVVATFKNAKGDQYIMIANKDYEYPTEGQLVFRSPKQLSKFNAAANRLEAPSRAVTSLEMKIPAGGYALYRIL